MSLFQKFCILLKLQKIICQNFHHIVHTYGHTPFIVKIINISRESSSRATLNYPFIVKDFSHQKSLIFNHHGINQMATKWLHFDIPPLIVKHWPCSSYKQGWVIIFHTYTHLHNSGRRILDVVFSISVCYSKMALTFWGKCLQTLCYLHILSTDCKLFL